MAGAWATYPPDKKERRKRENTREKMLPDGGIWVGLYSVHSLNTADKKSEAKNVSLVSNMQQTFVAFFGFTLVSRFKQRKGMLWNQKWRNIFCILISQDFTTSTPNPEEMLDGTKTYPGEDQKKMKNENMSRSWSTEQGDRGQSGIPLQAASVRWGEGWHQKMKNIHWTKVFQFPGRALPHPPHVPPPDYNEAITGR